MRRFLSAFFALFLIINSTPVFSAQQTLKNGFVFPYMPRSNTSGPTIASMLLDAADEKAAWIVQAPKTGNISKVGFRTAVVTTGATVDVRVETVSTTTGDPTGTLFAANTNASQVILSTDDSLWFLTTLTASAAVTKGDFLAVVIVNPSASPGNMNIARFQDDAGNDFPYADLFTTVWSKSQQAPVGAFEYDDGSYEPFVAFWPFKDVGTVSANSGSTPDEAGLYFSFPFPVRVTGLTSWSSSASGASPTFKLYDSDGSTVLNSISPDDNISVSTSTEYRVYYFNSTHSLLANTFYRLTMAPGNTTNVAVGYFDTNTAAQMDAASGGQNFHWTQRTDAGAWSETTTRRPFISLIIDAFDNGASTSGGGIHIQDSFIQADANFSS